jgi:hypothetical protein
LFTKTFKIDDQIIVTLNPNSKSELLKSFLEIYRNIIYLEKSADGYDFKYLKLIKQIAKRYILSLGGNIPQTKHNQSLPVEAKFPRFFCNLLIVMQKKTHTQSSRYASQYFACQTDYNGKLVVRNSSKLL